jgi:hypothetical protein
MRSPSLEFFYAKTERLITLAQSYTEQEHLAFIIKACRLKPYDYVFNERSRKLELHRFWFDEYGNSMELVKNKRIRLTFGDLRLDRKRIISTDLYYGLSLDRVAKMSKLVYLCAGKDEDLYQDCFLLNFLGMDNYFRTYLHWYGEWQPVSPLTVGMKHLKLLLNNADIKHFRQLSNSENLPIPCISGQTYLSFLPASQEFLEILKLNYGVIYDILLCNNR